MQPPIVLLLWFQVHEYLRSKLCSLYENDCIFDKFECCWNGNDSAIMTGSYNNFFRMFDRNSRKEVTYEASREIAKPKTILKPRKVPALETLEPWLIDNLLQSWLETHENREAVYCFGSALNGSLRLKCSRYLECKLIELFVRTISWLAFFYRKSFTKLQFEFFLRTSSLVRLPRASNGVA